MIDKNGMDRTEQFNRGAELVSQLVELTGAKVAVLKADSPSCGVGRTYDGTFSDTLIAGDGVTAERLRKLGMELFTEENF